MNDLYEPLPVAQRLQIAEAVRSACIQAALDGYEDAAMNGLCHEGAWEAAIEAVRGLDLSSALQAVVDDQTSSRWPSGSKK